MLPAFPKAQKILDDEWYKRMFTAKNKVFPTHIHPPVLAIIDGKTSDFQREDRQVKPLESLNVKTCSGQVKFSGGQLKLAVCGQFPVEGVEASGQGCTFPHPWVMQQG